MIGCTSSIDDCKCNECRKAKKEAIELSQRGIANTLSTFGPILYGRPKKKKLTRPLITEIMAPKIDEENWFFMTGTHWRSTHLHNERCGTKCICREGKNER